MVSPYLLPDGNVQIAFSGGRTSAYLLHQILEANGGIPEDRCVVSFQNTGREMPETLDFVAEVGRRWGVSITWLEYLPTAPGFIETGYQGASRNGEPFEALIRKRKFLPNVMSRFCTTELKVRTAKRYLMSLGWERWTNITGIRADEAARVQRGINGAKKERYEVAFPLYHAGVTKHDIAAFWRAQDFDLNLPNVKGNCWLGNCDGCFLKSEANVAAFTREYPERAAWWEEMEELAGDLTSGTAAHWSKRYTRREMREFMAAQGDMALSTEGLLCQADDGECFG